MLNTTLTHLEKLKILFAKKPQALKVINNQSIKKAQVLLNEEFCMLMIGIFLAAVALVLTILLDRMEYCEDNCLKKTSNISKKEGCSRTVNL